MKTKLTKVKRTPYWYRALNRVTPKSDNLLEEMLEKSSDWQDCACGKQSADIPRRAHSKGFALRGQPKDKILATLGDDFFNTIIDLYDFHYDKTVFDRNRKKAIRIMNKIEERAAIVLAQELAKKKNK